MNYLKSDSDFIDSLDFLTPPVKRIQNSRDVFGLNYTRGEKNDHIFRQSYYKSYEEYIKPARPVKAGLASATSLILNKTSEKQILKSCSVLSYTALRTSKQNFENPEKLLYRSKNKPLIKVTVIPKTAQTQTGQTGRLLRNRRHKPKIIQSSSSNQDNSIQNKNVYLVVTGRKRDKIYQLKATGSATVSSLTGRYGELTLEDLSNAKHVIQSLNMEKDRHQHDKELKFDAQQQTSFLKDNIIHNYGDEYMFSLENRKEPPKRSRIKIYGQLGITEDDRYLYKCGATVNDKPVTEFAHMTQDIATFTAPVNYDCPVIEDMAKKTDKVSQSTQVNFNVPVSTAPDGGEYRNLDKHTQCNCNIGNRALENVGGENCLKNCQSPLVIISVYSKASNQDLTKLGKTSLEYERRASPPKIITIKDSRVPTSKVARAADHRNIEPRKHNTQKDKVDNLKRDMHRFSRSRSPSPMKKPYKANEEKRIETRFFKTRPVKRNPDSYKAMRAIQNKISQKDKHDLSHPGPSKFAKPSSKLDYKSKQNSRKSSPLRSEDRATNTEHAKTKEVIINNFTRKLPKQPQHKNVVPGKVNKSKIKIDIDGERERYNVLFDQVNLTTDLRIKKTVKDVASQSGGHKKISESLENLLLLPEKETAMRQSFFTMNSDQINDVPMNESVSGVAIRDSLELFHRREEKYNSQTGFNTQYFEQNSNNPKFSGSPNKHYTGDDCSLSDPVERDKQIRELLGVDKSNAIIPKLLQAYPFEKEECPGQCIYRRDCGKRRLPELSFVNFFRQKTKKTGSNEPLYCVCTENNNNPCSTCCNHAEVDKSPCKECCPDSTNVDEKEPVNDESDHCCKNCPGKKLLEDAKTNSAEVYQQLILNRNIQIFLQIEQFSKQRPIILSRKQYEKVKKIVQSSVNNKGCRDKRKKNADKEDPKQCKDANQDQDQCSDLESVNEEVQLRQCVQLADESIQTENAPCGKPYCNRKNARTSTNNKKNKRSPNKEHGVSKTRSIHGEKPRNKGACCVPPKNNDGDQKPSPTVRLINLEEQERKCLPPSYPLISEIILQRHDIEQSGPSTRFYGNYVNHIEVQSGILHCNSPGEHRPLNENLRRLYKENVGSNRVNGDHNKTGIGCQRINIDNQTVNRIIRHILPREHHQATAKKNTILCEKHRKITNDIIGQCGKQIKPEECHKLIVEHGEIFQEHDKPSGAFLRYSIKDAHEKYDRESTGHSENRITTVKYNEKQQNNLGEHGDHTKNDHFNKDHKPNREKKTTVMLYVADKQGDVKSDLKRPPVKKTVSSLETQYTSMAFSKRVSSSNLAVLSDSSLGHANSFHTIFRGRRKSPTPNLGTSVYSLYSEEGFNSEKSVKCIKPPQDRKPVKRPFLRRLMSCLVMRSTRASELKLPTIQPPEMYSVNSSVDSYHISTSLGGVEVSSSIYDTSASFYSNHTILPVNSKMKRGFFSSVRGFLINRRS